MREDLTRRDPLADLPAFRSLFERLGNWPDWPRVEPMENLAIDAYDRNGSLVIKANIPGVKPEDVKITVENDVLTIQGDTHEDKEVKEDNYYLKEMRSGHMVRSVRLPANLDTSKAKASFENGVLELDLPRTKPVTPKATTIPVTSRA